MAHTKQSGPCLSYIPSTIRFDMLSGESLQHALSCSLFARQQQAEEEASRERRANGSNGVKGSKGTAKGSKNRRKEPLPRANKTKSQALPDPPPVRDRYDHARPLRSEPCAETPQPVFRSHSFIARKHVVPIPWGEMTF